MFFLYFLKRHEKLALKICSPFVGGTYKVGPKIKDMCSNKATETMHCFYFLPLSGHLILNHFLFKRGTETGQDVGHLTRGTETMHEMIEICLHGKLI